MRAAQGGVRLDGINRQLTQGFPLRCKAPRSACPARSPKDFLDTRGNVFAQTPEVHEEGRLHPSSDLPALGMMLFSILHNNQAGSDTCERCGSAGRSAAGLLRCAGLEQCAACAAAQQQLDCSSNFVHSLCWCHPFSPAVPLLAHQLSKCIFDAVAGGMLPFSPGTAERGFRVDDEISLLVSQFRCWQPLLGSLCCTPSGPAFAFAD